MNKNSVRNSDSSNNTVPTGRGKYLPFIALILIASLVFVFYYYLPQSQLQNSQNTTSPAQSTPKSSSKPVDREAQLADLNKKIEQLPELEEDIFYKCMEGKEISEVNIDFCQINTQEQVYLLAQDLISLKNATEKEINEAK